MNYLYSAKSLVEKENKIKKHVMQCSERYSKKG